MGLIEYEKIWQEWLKREKFSDVLDYHYQERQALIKLVEDGLGADKRFLEIGCGTAIDSYIIQNDIPGCIGYAMDLSFSALQLAQKISQYFPQKIFFSLMSGEKLAFPDKTFDVIFSQGVMEHFPDPLPMLKEQVRILKDDGRLIVSVPQKYNPYTLYKRRAMRRNKWEWGWETEYSLKELKSLGEKIGLKTVAYCGHEYAQTDYGLWYLRNICHLLQKKNPLRKFCFFRLIETTYDRFWQFFEKRWGHNFMVSISIVYEKNDA